MGGPGPTASPVLHGEDEIHPKKSPCDFIGFQHNPVLNHYRRKPNLCGARRGVGLSEIKKKEKLLLMVRHLRASTKLDLNTPERKGKTMARA